MNRSWEKNSRGLHSASSRCSLRPESSRRHLIVRIAGVLRLRAIKPFVYDRSAKRFAPTASRGRQDDGFAEGGEKHYVGVCKNAGIEKIRGSQDHDGEGGASSWDWLLVK